MLGHHKDFGLHYILKEVFIHRFIHTHIESYDDRTVVFGLKTIVLLSCLSDSHTKIVRVKFVMHVLSADSDNFHLLYRCIR